jgi:hypothetical protein
VHSSDAVMLSSLSGGHGCLLGQLEVGSVRRGRSVS